MSHSAAATVTAAAAADADKRRLHLMPRPIDVARLPAHASTTANGQSVDCRRRRGAARSTVLGVGRSTTSAAATADKRERHTRAPIQSSSEKHCVVQPVSPASTTSVRIPRTSTLQAPGRSVSSLVGRSIKKPQRSGLSLDEELKTRLKKLQLPKDDVTKNSKTVEELGEIILNELNNSYPFSFHWDKLNSGSYYDKTKVRYS